MIEELNAGCYCVSLDRAALRRALESDPAAGDGLARLIEERCPNLFAAMPVFLSREHVEAMAAVVRAVETVVALPAYQAALAWAPPISRNDPGARGVFMGYDFHIGAQGPRLIEINTNAGGALLNAVLGRAQRACCEEVESLVSGPVPAASLEQTFLDMFLAEWRAAGRGGRPRRIAIVDDAPESQYLYPEFLLFAQLFRRFGIASDVVSPEDLSMQGGELRGPQGPIDLVYNRLTDFALEAAAHAPLREAYLSGAAVITPHPHAHALYADKRNLSLLTNADRLREWGVAEPMVQALVGGIARTEIVSPEAAERLWSERRRLFFKPAAGYGSKAAYRGEKITRRVWDEVLAGTYVAQEFVPPGARSVAPGQDMKVDVRNYVYAGQVQMLAARLYQGQTTNLRTPGGGFAPVLTPAAATRPDPLPA